MSKDYILNLIEYLIKHLDIPDLKKLNDSMIMIKRWLPSGALFIYKINVNMKLQKYLRRECCLDRPLQSKIEYKTNSIKNSLFSSQPGLTHRSYSRKFSKTHVQDRE